MDLVILNKYDPVRIGNVVWLYLLSLGFKQTLLDPQIYVQTHQALKVTQPLIDALELKTINLRQERIKVENGNIYLVFPGGVTKLTFVNGQLAEKDELPFFKIQTKKSETVYNAASDTELPAFDAHTVPDCQTMHPRIRSQNYHLIDQMAGVISLLFPGYAINPTVPQTLQCEIRKRRLTSNLPAEYITINLASSKYVKDYPHFPALIAGLLAQGENVVAIGGDPNALSNLNHQNFTNLAGKISLLDTAAIIAASKLHIAGDTGTGHLAALLNVPVCSLFGQVTYPEICRPYSNQVYVIQSKDSWAPTASPQVVIETLQIVLTQPKQARIITL